jgi:hypothetical protein
VPDRAADLNLPPRRPFDPRRQVNALQAGLRDRDAAVHRAMADAEASEARRAELAAQLAEAQRRDGPRRGAHGRGAGFWTVRDAARLRLVLADKEGGPRLAVRAVAIARTALNGRARPMPDPRRDAYELQRALGQERAALESLAAERDSATGRAGESERLVQGLVGAQAEGLKAQGALEAEVRSSCVAPSRLGLRLRA